MNRRPLGRGLDALIPSGVGSNGELPPSAGPESSRAGLMMIAVDRVHAGRFQPRQRFDSAALEELAAAIRTQGIIEPLVVRPDGDRFELIAGERRLRAARLAQLTEVPIVIRELDDRAALEMSLVENLLREDLNPIEEAQAFARLNRDFNLTHDAIAGRIGKSRSHVTNMIRLTELPAAVLAMVTRGELTAGQVRPLLTLGSPDAQIMEARKIATGKITARQVEAIASARRPKAGRRVSGSARPSDPNLLALSEAIQRALKRKVRIVLPRAGRPGQIEIEFYNDEDLSGLTRTLSGSTRLAYPITQ